MYALCVLDLALNDYINILVNIGVTIETLWCISHVIVGTSDIVPATLLFFILCQPEKISQSTTPKDSRLRKHLEDLIQSSANQLLNYRPITQASVAIVSGSSIRYDTEIFLHKITEISPSVSIYHIDEWWFQHQYLCVSASQIIVALAETLTPCLPSWADSVTAQSSGWNRLGTNCRLNTSRCSRWFLLFTHNDRVYQCFWKMFC